MTEGTRAWTTGLIKVAPSALAYVQATGAAGISNAGLILGPEGLVVIDSLGTRSMNLAFLGRIRDISSLPITHLFVTHHHIDHVLGIQYYLPTQVICHPAARKGIIGLGPNAAQDWARRRLHFADDLGEVRLCVPNQTIEEKTTVYLGDRSLEVFHPGTAHTHGDLMVYLPEDRVLFAGDIVFHKVAPQGLQGHIGKWIEVVDQILAMDVETIVPGHGPVGGKSELMEMRSCLATIYEGARRGFDRGLTEQEALADIDLGPFQLWANPERYADCVAKAYSEFRAESEGGS